MNELLAGVGYRISSARKSKKMTQAAGAELDDVSYQTISSAELGKKALRPKNIIKDQSGTAGFCPLFADQQ